MRLRVLVPAALACAAISAALSSNARADAPLAAAPTPEGGPTAAPTPEGGPTAAPSFKYVPPPDESYRYESAGYYPSLAWMAAQVLLPSPELGIGRVRRVGLDGRGEETTPAAFGLRWQVTPILWSWGVNRHVDRWRFFVVDPLARVSGSIELNGSLEYFWGHVDRFIARTGVRATFPLLHRGEYLSVSLGTSTYQYDEATRVAYDVGAYFLYGVLGALVTVAPTHDSLQSILTFRIRYF